MLCLSLVITFLALFSFISFLFSLSFIAHFIRSSLFSLFTVIITIITSYYSFSSFTRPTFSLLAIIARRSLFVYYRYLYRSSLFYRSSLCSIGFDLPFVALYLSLLSYYYWFLFPYRSSLISVARFSLYRSSLISFALLFIILLVSFSSFLLCSPL